MSSTPGVDIVIAEDSRIQAEILERRLTEAGHRVRWGADGQAALDLVRDQAPAIIVSDIEMPGLSGFDLAHELRQTDAYRNVPLIALSSHASPKDMERARDHGFDEYVTKLDPKALLGMLSKVLSSPDTRSEEAA